MSARILSLALLATLVTPANAQQSNAGDYCYLVADNNGVRFDADILTAVSKTSGIEQEIGMTGTLNIEAVAFHPFTQSVFAADGGLLGTIDLSTGRFAPVGRLGTAYGDEGPLSAGDVDGLTFDPQTAELWGSIRRADTDFMVQIDPASGRVVQDAFGPGRDYVHVEFDGLDIDVDDIAVSPTTGGLFAVVTDPDENSTLVAIDRTTGAASRIAALSIADLEGLSFDDSGRLFATPGGDGPSMVELDVSTGEVTDFAYIGVNSNRDYEALTCMAYGFVGADTDDGMDLPSSVALMPAYPNPFNPTTTVAFALPSAQFVTLTVFDMLGREVKRLVDGYLGAGDHEVQFHAGDLPTGLYMYRLAAPDVTLTRSVTLLR